MYLIVLKITCTNYLVTHTAMIYSSFSFFSYHIKIELFFLMINYLRILTLYYVARIFMFITILDLSI
jgi:hypothetical protein